MRSSHLLKGLLVLVLLLAIAVPAAMAQATIVEQPTLIKRPLLDTGHERFPGFSTGQYQTIFNRHTL